MGSKLNRTRRAQKETRGEENEPYFFYRQFFARFLMFARSPPSERLEQANLKLATSPGFIRFSF